MPSLNIYFEKFANRCFWLVICAHITTWTLLPSLLRNALPKDALEGFLWGQHLEFGYDRNPWLNAWLTRFAVDISGTSGWAVYLLSQLSVGLAFWAVWKLGNKIFSPIYALIAVLMLEAVQYYTLAAIDFNDNVLELGLWPLLALLFYRAIKEEKLQYWIGVGIVAGLAMMAKYYTALMLLSMFIFLFIEPSARQQFRKKNLYIAVIIFILIILPHVIWLFNHQFITIQYAFMRVGENQITSPWHYFIPGMRFALLQIANFLPAIILFSFLLIRHKSKSVDYLIASNTLSVSNFDKRFLWIVGSGAYFITVILALCSGWQLHTLWGTPLLSLWGLILVIYLRPNITKVGLYSFLSVFSIIFITYACAYSYAMTRPNSHSSGNIPAREISQKINQIWYDKYYHPLHYVAGNRYFAGYIAYYARDNPSVYIEWDPARSPWINEQALKQAGAIFIQPVENDGTQFPAEVIQRYPNLIILPIQYFQRKRSTSNTNEIALLIGLLPPADDQHK